MSAGLGEGGVQTVVQVFGPPISRLKRGIDGRGRETHGRQKVVDLAGEEAFQTADDLAFRQPFLGAAGKSSREIQRCLKRYIARELYRALNASTTLTAQTSGIPM